jgi:hypothetical protein
VLKDPIPRLRELVPGIDPDLDEVIAGCIMRDRNQRFAQASDVMARLELLADRAERNEPREAMSLIDEESDLGVTQVYRAGSPLPVQTYSKGGKTIPMLSVNPVRPAPPSSDAGPQSAQGPSSAQGPNQQPGRPAWPSSAATPQPYPPVLQTMDGAGPQGTAVMPHMTEAGLALWRAQQVQQQGGFRGTTGQNPVIVPPFPPADAIPPSQLRPWVAVAMGVGIGLLALLAIFVASSLSQETPPDPAPTPVKSAGR